MSKVLIIILLIIILVLAFTYPTSPDCSLSNDTILLEEAVSEGWNVIIVKDVLATSPDVILITD